MTYLFRCKLGLGCYVFFFVFFFDVLKDEVFNCFLSDCILLLVSCLESLRIRRDTNKKVITITIIIIIISCSNFYKKQWLQFCKHKLFVDESKSKILKTEKRKNQTSSEKSNFHSLIPSGSIMGQLHQSFTTKFGLMFVHVLRIYSEQ